jgi:hypothetical protein
MTPRMPTYAPTADPRLPLIRYAHTHRTDALQSEEGVYLARAIDRVQVHWLRSGCAQLIAFEVAAGGLEPQWQAGADDDPATIPFREPVGLPMSASELAAAFASRAPVEPEPDDLFTLPDDYA